MPLFFSLCLSYSKFLKYIFFASKGLVCAFTLLLAKWSFHCSMLTVNGTMLCLSIFSIFIFSVKKSDSFFFCAVLNKIRYVDCDVQVLYSDDVVAMAVATISAFYFLRFFSMCVCVCVFVLWICNSTPFYSTFTLNNGFGKFSSFFSSSFRPAIAFILIRLCF